MDYEQKYKESLERAKEQLNGAKVFDYDNEQIAHDIRTTVYNIFPQLKESEDEKIRKVLINMFKGYDIQKVGDFTDKEIIAWLEKQKTSEESLQYLKENHSPSEMSDFQAAMNIAVAKAYDKGYNDGLEKHGEHNPAWSEEDEKQFSFCCAAIELSNYSSDEYRNYAISFLESLKDRVGCEVNCTTTSEPVVRENKGNYGGISPNSAWSEEDEKIFRALSGALARISSDTRTDSTSINYSFFAEIDWLRSLKERVGCEVNCTTTKEWSEDDEYNLAFIQEALLGLDGDGSYREKCCKMAEWLESLKDRVGCEVNCTTTKQWSEEDERERKRVVGLLEGWLSTFKETCYAEDCKCGIEWLRTLKDRVQPQNTWKPSDEQMKILSIYENVNDVLASLYQDLKKLKEE